jgi:hypothetical protein
VFAVDDHSQLTCLPLNSLCFQLAIDCIAVPSIELSMLGKNLNILHNAWVNLQPWPLSRVTEVPQLHEHN